MLILVASAAINTSTIPSAASECMSTGDIDASRMHLATLLRQPAWVADNENACRTYAALFYEIVKLRQATARCVDGEQKLTALDSEINAFNDLLATKCGG
jgi:hypothetical protein